MKKKPVQRIGILTAGGDSPGLNAAIRAVGKAAISEYGWEIIGFRDGFLGLAQNRWVRFDKGRLAGILTVGGEMEGLDAKADAIRVLCGGYIYTFPTTFE